MKCAKRKKTNKFAVIRKQCRELKQEMPELPGDDEVFKFITTGGFSSIAFIIKIAIDKGISELYATTLRIGTKELATMLELNKSGKLDRATFYVGSIFASDKNSTHDYYSFMVDVCDKVGWSFCVTKNHSKLLLAETKNGEKYVIETSSNLNENPKIEQFSIEQDAELFDFYKDFLLEISNGEIS